MDKKLAIGFAVAISLVQTPVSAKQRFEFPPDIWLPNEQAIKFVRPSKYSSDYG